MKNKPNKINVFGKKVPIKHVSKLKDEKGNGLDGEYDNDLKIIQIDEIVKGDDYKITLLHESFHAMLDRVGVNMLISDELEDIIVDNLAKFLVENFKIEGK